MKTLNEQGFEAGQKFASEHEWDKAVQCLLGFITLKLNQKEGPGSRWRPKTLEDLAHVLFPYGHIKHPEVDDPAEVEVWLKEQEEGRDSRSRMATLLKNECAAVDSPRWVDGFIDGVYGHAVVAAIK